MVTVSYRMLPSGYRGLRQVTDGYRVVTVGTEGYSSLLQVTEWL